MTRRRVPPPSVTTPISASERALARAIQVARDAALGAPRLRDTVLHHGMAGTVRAIAHSLAMGDQVCTVVFDPRITLRVLARDLLVTQRAPA